MARPREFDPDDAVAKAMEVFWTRGYDDASLLDLLEGMQLSRGSLYKAFGDKKTLFLKAMARYEEIAVDSGVEMLTGTVPANGWDRIISLFENVAQGWDGGDRRGCLLCSAAAGPASYDAEIAEAVARGLAKMRDAIAYALGTRDNPQADMLLTLYVGFRVLSRSNVTPDALHRSLAAIKALRPS